MPLVRCAVCRSEGVYPAGMYVLCLVCDARSYDSGRTWVSPPRPTVTRTVEED